jgi:hypothetical protein
MTLRYLAHLNFGLQLTGKWHCRTTAPHNQGVNRQSLQREHLEVALSRALHVLGRSSHDMQVDRPLSVLHGSWHRACATL